MLQSDIKATVYQFDVNIAVQLPQTRFYQHKTSL